jgi:hypothetical protein
VAKGSSVRQVLDRASVDVHYQKGTYCKAQASVWQSMWTCRSKNDFPCQTTNAEHPAQGQAGASYQALGRRQTKAVTSAGWQRKHPA